MPRISLEKRNLILSLIKSGESFRKIASMLKCHHQSVSNLHKNFFSTGSLNDKPKPGRPRKSSEADDRLLYRESMKNRFLSAKSVRIEANLQNRLSIRTVQRRLCNFGLHCRSAIRKSHISMKNRKLRRQWAQTYSSWDNKNWRRVAFSDESKFCRISGTSSLLVRRKICLLYTSDAADE